MKLKIGQIVNALPQITSLGGLKGLPAKITYGIGRTTKDISETLQHYEKTRVARLEELCERTKNGEVKREKNGAYKLSDENVKIFQEEIKSLLEQEVEVFCTPISIKEIENIVGITPDAFRILDWMFIE